jgi:hypothetical protein
MLRQTFIVERRTIPRVPCRKCGIAEARYSTRLCHHCRKETRDARSGHTERKPFRTMETDTPVPISVWRVR